MATDDGGDLNSAIAHRLYAGMLDKHKKYLIDNIKWDVDMEEHIEKYKLLPKQAIREIQRESSWKNRTYIFLAKMVTLGHNNAFMDLCDMLTATGRKHVADYLLYERDHLVFDFDGGAKMYSLSQYVDVIRDILFDQFVNEKDKYIRKQLSATIRKRMLALSRYLVTITNHFDTLKAQVEGTLVKNGHGHLLETNLEFPNLATKKGFEKLIELDKAEIGMIVNGIVEQEKDFNNRLQAVELQLDEAREEADHYRQRIAAIDTKATDAKIKLLEDVVKDQDEKISRLLKNKDILDGVTIPLNDYKQLLQYTVDDEPDAGEFQNAEAKELQSRAKELKNKVKELEHKVGSLERCIKEFEDQFQSHDNIAVGMGHRNAEVALKYVEMQLRAKDEIIDALKKRLRLSEYKLSVRKDVAEEIAERGRKGALEKLAEHEHKLLSGRAGLSAGRNKLIDSADVLRFQTNENLAEEARQRKASMEVKVPYKSSSKVSLDWIKGASPAVKRKISNSKPVFEKPHYSSGFELLEETMQAVDKIDLPDDEPKEVNEKKVEETNAPPPTLPTLTTKAPKTRRTAKVRFDVPINLFE